MPHANDREAYVWDRFIRGFHWTLAAAFAVAFLTEDALLVHAWSGYAIGVLIILRVIWGVVGPQHARFRDFLYGPSAVVTYLRDLVLFKAQRYLGHSPGGGAMVVVLLLSLAMTVGSGLIVYGADEGAGPLGPLFASSSLDAKLGTTQIFSGANADDDTGERSRAEPDREGQAVEKVMEDVHEFLANLTLVLVFVHIGAVLLGSFVHRENLIRAMMTGYKRG